MEQEIIKSALKEYYERKYKLYNSSNNLPVTEEEFDALKVKVTELKTIREVAEKYGAL
jgi:hypothetical protein